MHNKPRSTRPAHSHPVFLGIILILTLAISATAATLTVTSTFDFAGTCGGSGCSLRQAIASAGPGDTIDFSLPAHSTIALTHGELVIDKNLTITGPGRSLLQVQPETGFPQSRIFNIIAPATSVSISGLSISGGSADYGGGILLNSSSSLALSNCAVSANSADYGGGISSSNNGGSGSLTILNCSIVDNGVSRQGGGIRFSGAAGAALTIMNSTISDNLMGNAGTLGGGIEILLTSADQSATIINSTISGNSANGDGGGIYFYSYYTNATGTLTNCTIADNESFDAGGGIFNGQGTLNVRNTIIARNDAVSGKDFSGTLTSQGYNLIGNTSGTTITGTTTGNQLNVNPMLGTLQDNGGPNRTCALLSGSPAIDAGNSGGSITDQRGMARPVDSPTVPNASGGDGSDVGAYEVQPDQLPGCNTINTVVNDNGDGGTGTLRFVIANVCNGSNITFADNVRGAINLTSGELAINKSLTISGPGPNLLGVQRSAAAGTPNFRVFNIAAGVNTSISGLTVANGNLPSALDFGGGILNNGALTLSSVSVTGNSSGIGGGISNSNGTLNLTNSTISNNSANSGGGIAGGTQNLTNSTISGNTARTGNGGGITVLTASLINTTVANNSAPAGSGGGIFNNGNNGATVRARNSIIALNSAASGPDVSGALTSNNFNLVGNGSVATITPAQFADQIGTAVSPIDPLLGPLADNGGGTPTHGLLPGSPAIDKGHSSGAATDQRGFTRPVDRADTTNAQDGDGADIGAFEVPAPASVTTLANISTRLRVETGDNVLIGGFIVTGTQPKKVIIRAIGTSLPLADKLADPTLELHGPNGLIEANDNWVDSPNKQAIIDSTVPPASDLESAIVATLPANGAGYTAIVRGANGSTGIGVVEAYDLDTAADSRLANISTRGFVQTGDNVLIAGTIVVGPGSQKVLIRGIGPSLTVPGKMENPVLELRDSNGVVLQTNDNWIDSPDKQAIIDSTVPPTNDLESAIVATLPGNNASYTAVLRGVNDTTGIAVVEVYALQ